MAAGDSRNVQCTPEEYGMPYSTPPQRAYASVVAANTPAMTPPQEVCSLLHLFNEIHLDEW